MKCLVDGCDGGRQVRGLCKKHYALVSRMIRAGETSWGEAEAAGKILPAGRRGRHVSADRAWFKP